MSTEYTYSIQNDFPNHKVATDRLAQEIRDSAIVTALDYINTAGDDCNIFFKADLSPTDKTILDGIVATHSGIPLPNPTPKVQDDGSLVVAQAGLVGSEVIFATHDYCNRTTWFQDSVRVSNEALVDQGDGIHFHGANSFWIDMTHGYVLDEDNYCAQVPDGYAVVVTVDGVLKTQREPYENAGGDYIVDYANGVVESVSGSWAGKAVIASYNYATTSTFYVRPDAGKAIDINEAEIQYTDDVVLTDSVEMAVFGWVQIFAPQLWDQNGGPLPLNSMVRLAGRIYKRVSQMVDEGRGAYPVIPPNGGAQRGMQHATIGYPFQYEAITRLWNKYGMEMRVRNLHDRPFTGEHATASFYCLSRNESDLT